jgi:formylglycine-generating enzyme required for sulfatase activity
VESTFKNGFGVYDMHGLVWEWVYDFNSVITGDDSRSSGALNRQLYCAAGSQNAVNKEDYASFMRFAFRESLKANYTVANLGFRCAMDIK